MALRLFLIKLTVPADNLLLLCFYCILSTVLCTWEVMVNKTETVLCCLREGLKSKDKLVLYCANGAQCEKYSDWRAIYSILRKHVT